MTQTQRNLLDQNTTSVAKPAASEPDAIDALDAYCKNSAGLIVEAYKTDSEFRKASIMAKVLIGMKKLLTDAIMSDVMALQGTHLGFKTDRDDKQGYPIAAVREVLTHALIMRLRVTGNEWNIIASRLYVTVEGWKRLCGEVDGVSNIEIDIGVPTKGSEETALVACKAKWLQHGEVRTIECLKTDACDGRIPVKVNQYLGVDAMIGKARSKLYKRAYERMTGYVVGVADEDDTVTVDAASTPESEAK